MISCAVKAREWPIHYVHSPALDHRKDDRLDSKVYETATAQQAQ